MLRFLHAADVHLDSPLRGLEAYEGAPVDEIRGATRRALESLVDVAIHHNVDFVLIAGDIYDGDWKDHNTGLFFVAQMSRLREAGIPVVMISGNHDAANKMTRSLRLPENVELLGHAKPTTADSTLLRQLGVAVHGQSFGSPAEFSNLATSYPLRKSGMFNVGLLHTSLDGADGHEPYAPCTLEHLRQKEYDYWALGHVHTRQVCCEDPPVVFPGNVQGRHIREAGAKGCYLVTADERGQCELQFIPLDVFRWEVCTLDVSEAERPHDVLDRFSLQLKQLAQQHAGLPLAVRVEIAGATKVHSSLCSDPVRWTNELRAIALDQTHQGLWIEKVKWRTTPKRDASDGSDDSGPIGTLRDYLTELRGDDAQLEAIAGSLHDLQRKLPEELLRGDDALRFDDHSQLRQWLDDVEELLLSRLRGGVGDRVGGGVNE
jgi:DNA repair exonuclease SbcCD nuclease subunit